MTDNKYQNGKIYKIVAYETDDVYIGSTILPLNKRYSKHKSDFKEWINTKKKYCSSAIMFDRHGLDNCKIELIENFPCDNRKILEGREGYFMNEYDSCVNNNKAGRTGAQYRIDNKEKIKLYEAQYRTDNNEKIAQYRADNKEKQKKYDAHYRETNKDKINAVCECECGSTYTVRNKTRHMITKKHLKYLQTI